MFVFSAVGVQASLSVNIVTQEEWIRSLDNVDALLARVPPVHKARCEGVLRGLNRRGFSQAWQDWMLYQNFFAGKAAGFYVDIGTNDPLRISNTAFLDICLGWRGLCVEPQPRYHRAIRSQRSCALLPKCVMGRPMRIRHSGQGGIFRTRRARADASNSTSMQCVGLLDALVANGLEGRTVDLLSIDIEGSEAEVLRCMPFERLDIRTVLIETNTADLRALDAFFGFHGFANVATLLQTDRTWLDNLYVKLSSKLRHPGRAGACSSADKGLTMCMGGGEWQAWANPKASGAWGPCGDSP
ncbi:hypothetical protein EMIHUDRAFT_220836 [Emiliania huxleyi CCMP1516]|uniref:Methyltransferase FkbM domain-containing protein n=2 Tax=Emiliania huxleyi TaxID=2903 RepID=A0A0D3I0C1_EMIH1|nr:hypothetical protein EMIHUDRAFT_220836 [Emiliania huxleyi CCMP1516]EOD04706.1 hypothetical protein EMIHUDRAFT_220836 [Emiliania huxleyi CCMP1516]|eukprot:XP_005757135.1 hypothetical protein EMIHUDRAFT_220836 [Emiliania huxleyi CCMP1516]